MKLKDIVLTSSFFPDEPINSNVAIPLHLKLVVLFSATANEVPTEIITNMKGPFYFFCHCVSILKHFGNSVEPILKPSSSHFFLAALPDNLLTDFPSIVISSDDLFAKLH